MSDSSIQWTDKVWNPVVGCTVKSAGCQNCYAQALAPRLAAMGQPVYEGLKKRHNDGSVNWTGEVRCLPERLSIPLGWRKPARVFVNSMSDLFHESVPDAFIAAVFQTMADTPRHTYQILTKRPERMRAFLDEEEGLGCVAEFTGYPYPLPNVWLGVSTEDQATADERIPLLLQTPAAVRFLSCEPLLGPIAFHNDWLVPTMMVSGMRGEPSLAFSEAITEVGKAVAKKYGVGLIDWVITGGESGPHHRPFDPQWARDIRDQCVAAGVCFFHKQGSGPRPGMNEDLDGRLWRQFPGGSHDA
jgi:protein gp37